MEIDVMSERKREEDKNALNNTSVVLNSVSELKMILGGKFQWMHINILFVCWSIISLAVTYISLQTLNMNSMIVLLAIFGCALAQYRPIPAQQPGQQIAIVRQDSTLNPDGSYQWNYETANGIAAQEQGAQKAVGNEAGTAAQGSFSYTSPDGTPISLQYTADENGFQPQGAHLPVAPEIPAAIQKALAWIAAHPSAEDGPRPGNRRF